MSDQDLPKGQLSWDLDIPWCNDPDKATREQRKRDGRCEQCGDLLPISIWGLGECPKHPKQPESK